MGLLICGRVAVREASLRFVCPGCSSVVFLADFNHAITRPKARFDPQPGTGEGCEERRSSAVAEANPDDLDFRVALLGEVKEIFILADHDALLELGVATDVFIGGVC
jgi:hypothetical protein